MATESQALTPVPTPLAGTAADVWYTLQNKSNRAMFFAVNTAVLPADFDMADSFLIEAKDDREVKHPAGSAIHVWVNEESGRVAYEEAD